MCNKVEFFSEKGQICKKYSVQVILKCIKYSAMVNKQLNKGEYMCIEQMNLKKIQVEV